MLKKLKMTTKDWVSDHKKTFSRDRKLKKIIMCKTCHTFYYKNLWHFESPKILADGFEVEAPVRFTECPACLEQDNIFYEMETSTT